MNTSANTSIALAKTLTLLFMLMMLVTFLIHAPATLSVARIQGERVLENTIPKHVPIKLKIKKEKERSFRDMHDENWISEFELELTNTGDRPIYYVDLLLVSDVKLGGNFLVFPLAYGRDELGDIVSGARPEDIPIKPGETFVFTIHRGQVPAWKKGVREGAHREATRLQIKLEALSFGDGTGYFGNSGTAYPAGGKKQSGLNSSSDCETSQEWKLEVLRTHQQGVTS